MSEPDRTAHIIDAIDGALEDWTVSTDAMRWTPDPIEPDTIRIGAPDGVSWLPPDGLPAGGTGSVWLSEELWTRATMTDEQGEEFRRVWLNRWTGQTGPEPAPDDVDAWVPLGYTDASPIDTRWVDPVAAAAVARYIDAIKQHIALLIEANDIPRFIITSVD